MMRELHGVGAKVLDYIHLWTNALGKDMNPPISQLLVKLYPYCLWH